MDQRTKLYLAVAMLAAAAVLILAVWTGKMAPGEKSERKKPSAVSLNTASVSKNTAAHLTIHADRPGPVISPTLYGAFFEEINHAGDGGLYAELISNRSFEDDKDVPTDWSLVKENGAKGELSLTSKDLLNTAQTRALLMNVKDIGQGGRIGAENDGYWGIRADRGVPYSLSFFAKRDSRYAGGLTARLESLDGKQVYAEAHVDRLAEDWKQYRLTLKPTASSSDARFVIFADSVGSVYIDLVSLFPPTWKDRPNGLRDDLASMVAGMSPRFLRFPGGNYIEGNSLENAYKWKDTIGDIAGRPGHWNLWGYRVTDGLGFHEYLQWAEDMGAEPLYVVNVGISLGDKPGDYSAAPIADLGPWIQDALDAIEYANGPVTSKWGAVRARNGHPAPFNLKYVEIGNENNFQMSEYVQRYPLFYRAIKDKYPDITLIADANVAGQPVDMIDDHYYNSPQWFMDNAGLYDHYDRSGPKVFVGEYAVTNGAGKGNLMAALGEAAFMTGLERNADVVKMASYAPLFVNDNDRKWNPDAIVFNHAQSYGTPSYYAQKMFASNKGDIALPASLNMPDSAPKPAITGGIGLGAWNTEVEYDDVQVTSGGKTLFADSFDGKGSGWHPLKGNWTIDNGVYKQSEQITDARSTVIGDWSDYTITLRARKTAGAEGMLIMFGVKDPDNYYWWNIGGWNNTRNVIEKSVGGAKSIVGTSIPGSVETDRWYQIKIVVEGMRIRCYLDGQLVEDVTDTVSAGPLYYTASLDRSAGDIILKMVNVSGQDQAARISLAGVPAVASEAEASVMTADYPEQENDFADPDKVVPITKTISGIGNDFEYMFPKYSITVLRIQMKKD